MRKLQVLTVLSIGIMASATGFIQAQATDYTYFVDFSTKTVANFDDYVQTFNEDTYDLDNELDFTFNTTYKMNACPPSAATDMIFEIRYRLNATGTTYITTINLPDMPCETTDTFYQITGSINLPDDRLSYLIDDDANFIRFQPTIFFGNSSATSGRILTLTDPEIVFSVNYQFNTTYLFNYFLSDTQYITNNSSAGWSLSGSYVNDFDYVMTTAGNDRYFIINSVATNYGITRNKWAIDYNMEYFRGESIGARYKLIADGTVTVTLDPSAQRFWQPVYDYYYLNAANNSQAIVDAPEFNFTYEDCGWDVFDIPCFINNGLAYITNDAPIISDAITLLNAGIAMAAQTFGIIGAFSTDNVFGYLILAGFGYLAVRWFLKND